MFPPKTEFCTKFETGYKSGEESRLEVIVFTQFFMETSIKEKTLEQAESLSVVGGYTKTNIFLLDSVDSTTSIV